MNVKSVYRATSHFSMGMVITATLFTILTIWDGIGGEIACRIWGTILALFAGSLVILVLAREMVKLSTHNVRE